MTQKAKAQLFQKLHVKGDPLILYNIWDVGSAKAVAEAGAIALATGSWSVAAAWGYGDGEKIPLELVEQIASHIVKSVDVPVTIDFEGGYHTNPQTVANNVERIMRAGAVGINFEDQIVGSNDLYSIVDQCKRIKAMRKKADMGIAFFINARTDYFLKAKDAKDHKGLMNKAKERCLAYIDAGASGFFVPGLVNGDLIAEVCGVSALPVNIMMKPGVPSVKKLAELGVARVSHGPFPYMSLMDVLKEKAHSEISKL